MKLKLFIGAILAGMMATPAVAQQPFLEDGKAWTKHVYYPYSDDHSNETYFLKGDTTIDGRTYFKSWVAYKGDYLANGYARGLYYREDSGKVYVYNAKTEKEYLLYDFTMQPGDSFIYENQGIVDDPFKLTLVSVRDTITPYPTPVKRKKWTYMLITGGYRDPVTDEWHYDEEGPLEEVLEGIGSEYCCGIDDYPFLVTGHSHIEFRCCHGGDGNVLYTVDDDGWCFYYATSIDEVKDEAGGLKVTANAGGRLAFAWNAGAAYRTLSLYTADGRLVARRRLVVGDTSAEFTGLARGVYLYYFTADGQTKAAGKVLVE